MAREEEEEKIVGARLSRDPGEGLGHVLGRRLFVDQQPAGRMKQPGILQAGVKLAGVVVGIVEVRRAPAIIGDANQQRDDVRAAGDAHLARQSRARRQREPIGAGGVGRVAGRGDDIFAVLGEHRVDSAVQRLLAVVGPAVVIGVLGAVGAAEDQIGVHLVGGEVDPHPLAATAGEAVAVGELARRAPAVAALEAAVDAGADRDRLGRLGPADGGVRGRHRRRERVAAGHAGPVGRGRNAIVAVDGQFEDEAAVRRIAAAFLVVVGEVEAPGAGDDEIGIEIARGEPEVDALTARAVERVDVFELSRTALMVVGRQLAGKALPRRDRRRRRRTLGESRRRAEQGGTDQHGQFETSHSALPKRPHTDASAPV